MLSLVRTIAAVSLIALVSAAPSMAEPFTDEQKKAIETMIGDYLQAHPEAIVQSVARAEEQRQLAIREEGKKVLKEKYTEITQNPASPALGNPKGDMVVVEYFDYQCGHCKAVVGNLQALLKDDKNVRVVFKEYPILGPGSMNAAKAALAAHKQGKYLPFHLALMAEKGALSDTKIFAVAQLTGLDVTKLKQDMESPDIAKEIENNRAMAPQLGIPGTPGFIIGHEVVSGEVPLDDMKKIIQVQREDKTATTAQ